MAQENILVKAIKKQSSDYNLSLSLLPLSYEEFETDDLNQLSKLYHLPLTYYALDSFESLVMLSSDNLHYASKFQPTVDEYVDFPIHVFPVLECSLIERSRHEISSLTIRIPSVNHEDGRSVLTLDNHVAQGRWISEKLRHRWIVQLMTSMLRAHKKFLCFPEFSTANVYLISDETILNARNQMNATFLSRNRRQLQAAKEARLQARVRPVGGKKQNDDEDGSGAKPLPLIGSNLTKVPRSPLKRGNTDVSSQPSLPSSHSPEPKIAIAPRKDAWLLLPIKGLEMIPMEPNSALPLLTPMRTKSQHIVSVSEDLTNFSWLRHHVTPPEFLIDNSLFETLTVKIRDENIEVADKCRHLYQLFIKGVYRDLRCIGYIVVETYLRRELLPNERENLKKPAFLYADLIQLYDLSRLSRGMTRLLQLCYSDLSASGMIENDDLHVSGQRELRGLCLRQEEEVFNLLQEEFRDLGGIEKRTGVKDEPKEELWTNEDQMREDTAKQKRCEELIRKARQGKMQARARNIENRKQLLFDMLPEEQQAIILKQRAAYKKAVANSLERDALMQRALFHHWNVIKIKGWLKEALMISIKKNYFLKKSGVKLSIEQKHEYDRVFKPIEVALGKILLTAPYIAPVEKIEGAQAMLLLMNKPKEPRKKASKKNKDDAKESQEVPSDYDGAQGAVMSPAQSHPSSPSGPKSQSPTATPVVTARTTDALLVVQELDEMIPLEKERRYTHVINWVCDTISNQIIGSTDNVPSNKKNAAGQRLVQSSATVLCRYISSALAKAKESLEKSPVASLLPADQFKEKLLIAAGKILLDWDALIAVGSLASHSIGMKERSWTQQIMACIAFSLVSKFVADERLRAKGEDIAASRIQGLARGHSVRRKVAMIWKLANEQFDREEEKRKERQAEIDQLNRITAKANLKRVDIDESSAEKLALDLDVEWASVHLKQVNSFSAHLRVSLAAGCQIPKDEFKRGLQVKFIARLIDEPEMVPDPLSSTFIPLAQGVQPRPGLIEIAIDDAKRILILRQQWLSDRAGRIVDVSPHWETLEERFLRIKNGGEEDAASALIQLDKLIPHRNYKIKVMVNTRYRPKPKKVDVDNPSKKKNNKFVQVRDNPEDIRLSRAGYLNFLTSGCVPCPPEFLHTDIIHYDHKIPLQSEGYSGEQKSEETSFEDILDDKGLSAVDKLEKFNALLNSKKNKTRAMRNTGEMSSSPILSRDLAAPIDHSKGIIERRVSCRLNWTIPYNNGNRVIQYEIQKMRDDRTGYDPLVITSSTFYTDTVPCLHPMTGRVQTFSTYRIRANNEYGWSPYSQALCVDLIDKISCNSLSRVHSTHSGERHKSAGSERRTSSPLSRLPHGVTIRSHSSSYDTSEVKRHGLSHVLTEDERHTLLCGEMYCLPPYALSESNPQTATHDGSLSNSKLKSEFGKTLEFSKDSALSGETLHGVNESLQQWLCRLADACPLDEASRTPIRNVFIPPESSNDYFSDDEYPSPPPPISAPLQSVNLASNPTPVLESVYVVSGLNPKKNTIPTQGKVSSKTQESDGLDNLIQRLAMVRETTRYVKFL